MKNYLIDLLRGNRKPKSGAMLLPRGFTYTPYSTSNDTFKYLELVEVRDADDHEWKRRLYLGTIPTPSGERHYTMGENETERAFDGIAIRWRQIRKIQPATLEERVAALEEQLRKIQQP